MERKLAPEVAQAEVEKWLDWMKIMPGQREKHQDEIDILIEAVSYGNLELSEDMTWTQHLLFPFGEEIEIKNITYKKRINDKLMEPYLKGVKATDGDGRILAYKACMTGLEKALVKVVDPQDGRVLNALTAFFSGF